MLTGMARSSVRMQRNSPETHMTATQTVLITHQLKKNIVLSPKRIWTLKQMDEVAKTYYEELSEDI